MWKLSSATSLTNIELSNIKFIIEQEEGSMDKYKILIGGSIICLIFDNLPKILQLNTISSGLANRFTWYPLFLLFLLNYKFNITQFNISQ